MSSPPPPTPPPPPSSPSSYTSFPILAISILGILTTAILLVSYYVFVIKCCLNWRRADDLTRLATSRSRRRRRGSLTEDPSPFTFYASTAAEPRGLEESAIQAIPIIRFRKTVDADDDDDKDKKKSPTGFFFLECAVCLTEFADGERVRLLPNCSHAFHIDCIDTWLQTNSNCPLCRSEISSGLIPSEHFMAHFPIQIHHDSFVIDVRDDGVGGSTGRHPTSEPTPTSTTGRQNQSSPSPRKLQERRWTEKKGRKLQHQSSMGDECIDVRKQDERFPSVQPIRRSISMDSSTDRQLYIAVQEILRQQRSSQDASAAAAIGEGSSSGAGGGSGRLRRAFFSFGRSSRNAVLPIQFDP